MIVESLRNWKNYQWNWSGLAPLSLSFDPIFALPSRWYTHMGDAGPFRQLFVDGRR